MTKCMSNVQQFSWLQLDSGAQFDWHYMTR